jgi:hypothetical protein
VQHRPSDLDPYPEANRDLATHELWARSLRRSQQRRHLKALSRRQAPRRKALSLAAGSAILASPVLTPLAGAASLGAGRSTEEVSTIASTAGGDTRLLEFGDTGPAVAAIQRQLGIDDDGIFGPITRRAVVTFQANQGLKPNGVVDARTWAQLFGGQVLFYDRSGGAAAGASLVGAGASSAPGASSVGARRGRGAASARSGGR